TLHIGPLQGAVWGYLAVAGGIATPPVLGSRSTHLRSGLGGLDGRALRAGDALPFGSAEDAPCLKLTEPWQSPARPIRVVPGPQDDFFG
ncbi:hypothetical protein J8J27_29285, partial [Mycobacterium tuberculosis]|nr:hypothetical protein [Mycobacterium tuberculosis]